MVSKEQLDTSQLPPGLTRLLRYAQRAERTARGPHRRPAFRFTRLAIGGALEAGYPSALLAECLDLRPQAIAARVERDGWLPADTVELAAGLDPGTLARWYERGELAERRIQATGTLYRAAQVVLALGLFGPPVLGTTSRCQARSYD